MEMLKIKQYSDGIKNVASDGTMTLLEAQTPVSMNFWGFQPVIFEYLEKMFVEFLETNMKNITSEFLIPTAVNQLVVSDMAKVKVLESDAEWFGITYQEDRPFVVERLKHI